jgi:hypothetical protein
MPAAHAPDAPLMRAIVGGRGLFWRIRSAMAGRQVEREAASGLQVGAGAERLVAGAGEDDGADVGVGVRFAVAGADPGDDVGVDGIALVRTVDRDPVRAPALLADDRGFGVAHRAAPASGSISAMTRFEVTWSPLCTCRTLTVPAIGAAWMCSISSPPA